MTMHDAIKWLCDNVPEYVGIWTFGNARALFLRDHPALCHACDIFEHCTSANDMYYHISRYVDTMQGYHSPALINAVSSELVGLLAESGQNGLAMYALRYFKELGYGGTAESGEMRL